MKRVIVGSAAIAVIGLAVVSCFIVMWTLREEPKEWTTRSPEALQEFEKGLEAIARFYWSDAEIHFERALELDPKFAIAKLHLNFISPHGSDAFDRRVEELRDVSLDGLEPQEKFLLRYWLARFESREEEAETTLTEFLAANPENFFALRARCDQFWHGEDTEEAVECYGRLLEVHPNWVRAHNRLGYIALAQGRFAEAEEHFETYKYIAPDQANPYDSLGELLTLIGRYEEAEESLLRAIEIRKDFCAAYSHLVRLYSYQVATDRALVILDDAAEADACPYLASEGEACSARAFLYYLEGRFDEAWEIVTSGCSTRSGSGVELIAHRLALLNGTNRPVAVAMEETLEGELGRVSGGKAEFLEASLRHMQGTRLLIDGDAEGAAERYREADEKLSYWSSERATFKIFNRLHWLLALQRAGLDAEASALEQQINDVNPRIVDELPLPGLE